MGQWLANRLQLVRVDTIVKFTINPSGQIVDALFLSVTHLSHTEEFFIAICK